MTVEFNEGLQSANRDPLDAQSQDFDWLTLYQRLNEDATSGENEPNMAAVVVNLLQMLLPRTKGRIRADLIGLRVVALAWVLNPSYFADSPSLRVLARRCRVKPKVMALYTGHYSRLIGWRNRAQKHAWNWQRSEAAASGSESQSGHPGGTFHPSVKG